MSARAHRFIEEFFALPADEQAEVLEAIVPSDEHEFPADYRKELEERVRAVETGTAAVMDGNEVMTRLRAKHAQR